MEKLKGIVPPMITPFDSEGNLNEIELVRLVEYLSPRVDGLFICGSYGSGPLMSIEERKKVAEIVKKTATGDTKIIVHTGTTSTHDTVTLSLHAKEIGCDAAAAVGPYYYDYKDNDLIRYYEAIIKALNGFPFFVYHNPKFQGYPTSMNVMRALKDVGLSGIKDATFDILQFATYARELVDENFDVALGTEAMWVSAHTLGCRAFIPGIGNVFPELCREMWKKSMDGDLEGSVSLQFEINQIREIMYLARSTQLAIYAIAELRGIINAHPRSPFVEASHEEKENIKKALQELGVM